MLLDTPDFSMMRASLQAISIKQEVLAHNIANYETPKYKARTVNFEQVLHNALNEQGEITGPYKFRARISTQTDTEVRVDGNNVDLDKDSASLFDTYLQSVYLYEKIGGNYANINYILNQQMR